MKTAKSLVVAGAAFVVLVTSVVPAAPSGEQLDPTVAEISRRAEQGDARAQANLTAGLRALVGPAVDVALETAR